MTCHIGKSGAVIYCTGNLMNLTVSKIDRANRVKTKKQKLKNISDEYKINPYLIEQSQGGSE